MGASTSPGGGRTQSGCPRLGELLGQTPSLAGKQFGELTLSRGQGWPAGLLQLSGHSKETP